MRGLGRGNRLSRGSCRSLSLEVPKVSAEGHVRLYFVGWVVLYNTTVILELSGIVR